MSKIVVWAQNPLDLKREDLRDYVKDIRKYLPETEVFLNQGERIPSGVRQVTWWEVVRVYLDISDEIKGFVVGKLLELGYQWAKRRFKRLKKNRRPKCIVVHGQDGREAGSIVLKEPTQEPTTVAEAITPGSITQTRKKPTVKGGSRKIKKKKTRKKTKRSGKKAPN